MLNWHFHVNFSDFRPYELLPTMLSSPEPLGDYNYVPGSSTHYNVPLCMLHHNDRVDPIDDLRRDDTVCVG